MKRSTAIALVSMGAAAVAFYAVRDEGRSAEAHVFRTVEDCILAPDVGDARCRAEYRQALETHERTAPRFASNAACEAEFGPNACQQAAGSPGAPAAFIPLLAGYMFGNPASGRPFASQPLYPTRPGTCPPDPSTGRPQPSCPPSSSTSGTGYRTGHGAYIWVARGSSRTTTTFGRSRSSSSTTTRVSRRVASSPPSRTSTVRQGFGGTSRSFSFSSRGG